LSVILTQTWSLSGFPYSPACIQSTLIKVRWCWFPQSGYDKQTS